jgi:rhodanese-related sulfurtransferase
MKKEVICFDVREKEEYDGGHAEGAVNVPLGTLEGYVQNLSKDTPLATCCASGRRSAFAKSMLVSLGFTDVTDCGPWTEVHKVLGK